MNRKTFEKALQVSMLEHESQYVTGNRIIMVVPEDCYDEKDYCSNIYDCRRVSFLYKFKTSFK